MASKNTDIRVQRTHKNIIDAFIALTYEEGMDKVTVQDIADRAMINRATFYAHFKDKNDLYNQIFKIAMGTFSALRAPELFSFGRIHEELITDRLTEVFKQVRQQREIFLLIFNTTNFAQLIQQFKKMLAKNISGVLLRLGISRHTKIPADLVLTYLVSTFAGALQWWLQTDNQMSAHQLAVLYVKLMKNGHLKLIGLKIDD